MSVIIIVIMGIKKAMVKKGLSINFPSIRFSFELKSTPDSANIQITDIKNIILTVFMKSFKVGLLKLYDISDIINEF
jgi:hypothetical protein